MRSYWGVSIRALYVIQKAVRQELCLYFFVLCRWYTIISAHAIGHFRCHRWCRDHKKTTPVSRSFNFVCHSWSPKSAREKKKQKEKKRGRKKRLLAVQIAQMRQSNCSALPVPVISLRASIQSDWTRIDSPCIIYSQRDHRSSHRLSSSLSFLLFFFFFNIRYICDVPINSASHFSTMVL